MTPLIQTVHGEREVGARSGEEKQQPGLVSVRITLIDRDVPNSSWPISRETGAEVPLTGLSVYVPMSHPPSF
jgi:hypothetical protein